jgi:hypothetical protein
MSNMAKVFAFCVATCIAFVTYAAECTSGRTFVILRPETSSFWTTATNSSMSVPVDFPKNSRSAKLEVSADVGSYRFVLENITADSCSIVLPAAIAPRSENVYRLKLTFDDGSVRTAKLAVVQGIRPGNEGSARCVVPYGALRWNRIYGRVVLPVPYGCTSLAINGRREELDGSQGWYALDGGVAGGSTEVSAIMDGEEYSAVLARAIGGMFFHVR